MILHYFQVPPLLKKTHIFAVLGEERDLVLHVKSFWLNPL